MVLNKIVNNNLFSPVLAKHSNAVLVTVFSKAVLNSDQLTQEYKNDPIKINLLLNNIIARHIQYRDALMDPTLKHNATIIENHIKYFFDSKNNENAQIRGIQAHLSQQMFNDFGRAGNGIQNTKFSGSFLGSLYSTTEYSSILLPNEMMVSVPASFQHGIEVSVGLMYSAAMGGHSVAITADNPSNYINYNVKHIDTPCNQNVFDFNRKVCLVKNNKLEVHAVFGDAKMQTIDKAFTPVAISESNRIISIGSVDIAEEKAKVRYTAQLAIMGFFNAKPVDYSNNSLVPLILKKAAKDGLIEDLNMVTGVPIIISNRHNDS